MTDAPLNRLEAVIREGGAGRATPADLHAVMLKATLFVPSATEVDQDPMALVPLLAPTPRSEIGMVLAFADPSLIPAEAAERAPHCLQGAALIALLQSEVGILLVAGPDAAAELDPATLADLRDSLVGQGEG